MQKSIDLADLLVKTGYSESDTIVQASGYYREALKYYLLPLKTFPRSKFHTKFPWVEDCILLLFMVLGGDFVTMRVWSKGEYASNRLKKCYRRANELDPEADWDVYDADLEDRCPAFTFAGYATDDVTFQAMQLLGLLKRLNEYNRYTEGLEIYKRIMETEATNLGLTVSVEEVVNQIAPWLMGDLISHNPFESDPDGDSEAQESATKQVLRKRVLMDLIDDVIASIKYHEFKHGGDPNFYPLDLVKGTFNKATAPRGMFGGGKGNLPQYYKVPYTNGTPSYKPFFHMAPAELWMILRDVFVQTKGLQSLLFIMMDLQRGREEEETVGHDDDDGDESD